MTLHGAHIVTLVATALLVTTAAVRAEALSPEKAGEAVAQQYGVQVLRVRPVEVDGTSAYAVVVMNPAGNFNEAFRVTTLIVDPATGRLVPQFRHRAAGYDLPGADGRSPPGDDVGTAVRRLTNRER